MRWRSESTFARSLPRSSNFAWERDDATSGSGIDIVFWGKPWKASGRGGVCESAHHQEIGPLVNAQVKWFLCVHLYDVNKSFIVGALLFVVVAVNSIYFQEFSVQVHLLNFSLRSRQGELVIFFDLTWPIVQLEMFMSYCGMFCLYIVTLWTAISWMKKTP